MTIENNECENCKKIMKLIEEYIISNEEAISEDMKYSHTRNYEAICNNEELNRLKKKIIEDIFNNQ